MNYLKDMALFVVKGERLFVKHRQVIILYSVLKNA